MIAGSTVFHSFQCQGSIVIAQAFHIGVRYNRDTVIAYHTAGIIGAEVPNRNNATFFVFGQHSVYKIVGALLFYDGV